MTHSLVLPANFDWKRACESKGRYSTELRARQHGQNGLRDPDSKHIKRLWVYPCINCRGWHLTRRENGQNVRAALAVTRRELYEGSGL